MILRPFLEHAVYLMFELSSFLAEYFQGLNWDWCNLCHERPSYPPDLNNYE